MGKEREFFKQLRRRLIELIIFGKSITFFIHKGSPEVFDELRFEETRTLNISKFERKTIPE